MLGHLGAKKLEQFKALLEHSPAISARFHRQGTDRMAAVSDHIVV
jgi:hypothetical protein